METLASEKSAAGEEAGRSKTALRELEATTQVGKSIVSLHTLEQRTWQNCSCKRPLQKNIHKRQYSGLLGTDLGLSSVEEGGGVCVWGGEGYSYFACPSGLLKAYGCRRRLLGSEWWKWECEPIIFRP